MKTNGLFGVFSGANHGRSFDRAIADLIVLSPSSVNAEVRGLRDGVVRTRGA